MEMSPPDEGEWVRTGTGEKVRKLRNREVCGTGTKQKTQVWPYQPLK